MRYSLNIYRRLISVQIRSQMQYRLSFFLDVFATLMLVAVEFGALYFVLERFGGIGGWALGEVAFLYGMVTAAFGSMDMLFSGFDPRNFGQNVRQGRFDQLLLRPVNITVQVLGSHFMLRRIGRIVQGIVIFSIALSLVDIAWTPAKLLYLPVVFVSQVAFFGGLFIIGATISFWTIESIEAVNVFTYGGQEMISYPMHIYPNWMQRVFTYALPAIFLNYYPALYILGKPDPLGMPAFAPWLAPVAGGLVMLIALRFWQFGISQYQSTGT